MQLLTVFPFLEGINELHIVFILDIVLLCLLLYKVSKNNSFVFTKDIKFIFILLWSVSYLLTMFWVVDTELSWLGFLKFFTVPLFIITIMQYKYTPEQKNKWFDAVGKIGAVMVGVILIVSLFERIITGENNIFFYQNRLAGFFNYANSFALFLLIGIIIIGFKKNIKLVDFIVSNMLLIGILLTNSRAIMIITVFSYLLILIFNKESRKKNFINLGIMIVVSAIVTAVMQNFGVSNRIPSGNSGEWLLRLLYYKDALRMTVKNIFGYGYMAWWYMQEGLQSGAYDTQYVHNGLLQIVVDVGIIPALLIVITFIMGFFDKKVTARDRVLMLVILGHSLIDFNMEFLAITLVLFMTLEFDKKQEKIELKKIKVLICGLGFIYTFFAIITLLNNWGQYRIANSIFPYSIALNEQLGQTENIYECLEISEKLYDKNKYFLNASSFLSIKEQSSDNYEEAHKYEFWIVKNKKYTMSYYIQYVKFLEKAIQHYYSVNDIETMKKYVERLINVETMIENVKETSDDLAYRIQHKPRLEMPEEMQRYIEEMKLFYERVMNE